MKLFIWWTNPDRSANEYYYPEFSAMESESDMAKHGWIKLDETEVELPSREVIAPVVIESLRKKQATVRAEAERHAMELERQIGKFLALEAPEATSLTADGFGGLV